MSGYRYTFDTETSSVVQNDDGSYSFSMNQTNFEDSDSVYTYEKIFFDEDFLPEDLTWRTCQLDLVFFSQESSRLGPDSFEVMENTKGQPITINTSIYLNSSII